MYTDHIYCILRPYDLTTIYTPTYTATPPRPRDSPGAGGAKQGAQLGRQQAPGPVGAADGTAGGKGAPQARVLDEGALVGLSALNGDPGPRRRYVQLQLPAAPPTTESLPVQIKALMRGSGGAPAGRWHDIEMRRLQR